MELYLFPNDPVNTVFITSDGFLRYRVHTPRSPSSLRACRSAIQRIGSGKTNKDETFGEIAWGGLGKHSVVYSKLFKGHANAAEDMAVRVKDLLWKINTFGT